MLLSDCIGAPVLRDGERVGVLADLAASPRGATPVIEGALVRDRRKRTWATWGDVISLSPERVVLAEAPRITVPPGPVLLARDVLDAQLVDERGHRVVRIGDVDLRLKHGLLHVVGVEVGLASVLRRLGLRRLSRRAPRHRIAWPDVHLATHRAAALTHAPAARRPARRHRFPTHTFRRRGAAP